MGSTPDVDQDVLLATPARRECVALLKVISKKTVSNLRDSDYVCSQRDDNGVFQEGIEDRPR